jgi:hypothetical protein
MKAASASGLVGRNVEAHVPGPPGYASAARNISGYAGESILPAGNQVGLLPRAGSNSTSRERTGSTHPATLPVPLLSGFTFSRKCCSIQAVIETSVRSAAA